MPDGKTMVILLGAALVVGAVGKVRRPVAHAGKKTGQVVSQPFRHPVKDLKAIGHFLKGDR